MPLPWQRKVVHVASQVAAVATGIDSLAPSSDKTTSVPVDTEMKEARQEVRWRDHQRWDTHYAEFFIPLDKAIEMLGKPESYIRACAEQGRIEMTQHNGMWIVAESDIKREKELVEQFPYPPQEETPHA